MLDRERSIVWKIFPTAIVCLGAADVLAENDESPSWFLIDFISVTVFVLLVGAFLVWLFSIAQKFRERRREEGRETLKFEAQMRHLSRKQEETAQTQQIPVREKSVNSPDSFTATPPVTPPPAAQMSAIGVAEEAVEGVLSKIRTAGLYDALEGRVYLSDGKTEGVIIRMTDGNTAVILPYLESADFLAKQIKRFDFCIVPLLGEQVCVISPLGQYIANGLNL